MELMALDVADALRHAGGWMFDRVASGWTVIVILPKCSDPRSLHILGAQVVAPEDALDGHTVRTHWRPFKTPIVVKRLRLAS
jgi:hypothetical protein